MKEAIKVALAWFGITLGLIMIVGAVLFVIALVIVSRTAAAPFVFGW